MATTRKKAVKKASKKKPVTKTNPNGAGRPTPYRQSMCDKIKEIAQTGAYQGIWWRKLGISASTGSTWRKTHKEFSEAYDEAVEIGKSIVIAKGEKMIETPGYTQVQFNALKWFGAVAFKMRENDTREEIDDSVAKQLPTFINNDR